MKETQFRKNGKNDSRAGEEDTQKSRNRKLSREKKQNKRKQKEEYMMFDCGLQNIFRLKNGQSRSINWETRNGEKGKAAWHPAILVRPEKVPRASRK